MQEPFYRERPLYIILDEANDIGLDKKFNKLVEKFLFQSRHFNIYFIALGQSLLKQDCSYKQKFNVRVTFSAEASVINAFIDKAVASENDKLLQREFIVSDGRIRKGKSYKYDFKGSPTGMIKKA